MATSQHYSLRWNNYLRHITFAFDNLRNQDEFVDVTLCCDGRKIKAHKMLLSACSGYFKDIFKENPHPHPIIIFKFIKYDDLNAIIEFMYQGEVNIQQDALQSFLQTAELLAVQGLTSEEKEKPKIIFNRNACLEQEILEEQLVKNIPSAITTITESSQSQHSSIDLHSTTSNITKKRKIIFSDDEDNLYTETVSFPKDDQSNDKDSDIQFIPDTVKMDIPEYLHVTEEHSTSDTHIHGKKQDCSNENANHESAQFTSEYEIVAESEIDEKFQPRGSTEYTEINTVAMDNMTEVGFRCSICWKGFKHPMSLTLHKDLHSGKTQCPVCRRNFSRSYDMRTHLNKIHKLTLSVAAKLNFQKL